MFIQIRFPPEHETLKGSTAIAVAILLGMLITTLPIFKFRFLNSCAAIYPLSTNNMTFDNKTWRCSIPYDDCRCSILSNRTDITGVCLTELETITGHICPLIIYVLQMYLIYNLVSFKGKYGHIFADICWIIALVIFIIIAIAAHGSDCFHYRMVLIISATGICLMQLPTYLSFRVREQYRLRERFYTSPDQQLTTSNHEQDITLEITLF